MPTERKKSPPRTVKPTGKQTAKTAAKPTDSRRPLITSPPKPRGSALPVASKKASARPVARPASPPPAKRQDEAKLKKTNDRLIEKARRDAAARHAKMLTAHANRKTTGQGRTPPIPTLEEFTLAFVQDRLRKSQARKRQQADTKPVKSSKGQTRA